jgi:hypothetical protein
MSIPNSRRLKRRTNLFAIALLANRQSNRNATKYLPRPNPRRHKSKRNAKRYTAYLTRAVFYNVAQRTQAGLVGQVFLRDPQVEVPTLLDPVVTDATGSGVPLDQIGQELTAFGCGFGRAGVYIDYPSVAAVSKPTTPGNRRRAGCWQRWISWKAAKSVRLSASFRRWIASTGASSAGARSWYCRLSYSAKIRSSTTTGSKRRRRINGAFFVLTKTTKL